MNSSWEYKLQAFDEIPEGAYGFTYLIEAGDYYYYGKKNFYTQRKVPKGKKELALQDGRASKKKLVIKESNWKSYCSSSKDVKEFVSKGVNVKRVVIDICYSAKELTFRENKLLYANIEGKMCLNDNCSGKFFKSEINSWNDLSNKVV